jgi:DNA-binding PadR family transcriptional regulator
MTESLSDLELLVMAAVLHAGNDAYGVRVAEEIEVRTGRDVSAGTLYRVLERLERRGDLSSTLGEATPERGGRAKTYYKVEPAGLARMRSSVRRLGAMLDGLQVGWEGSA